MVAKAGLEHAIYIIRQDKFGGDGEAYNNDNTDTNYDYYVSTGDPSWPGDGVFDGSDYDNSGNDTADSQWIYFQMQWFNYKMQQKTSLHNKLYCLI